MDLGIGGEIRREKLSVPSSNLCDIELIFMTELEALLIQSQFKHYWTATNAKEQVSTNSIKQLYVVDLM